MENDDPIRTLTTIAVFVSTINAVLRGRAPDSAIISNMISNYARPFVKSFDDLTKQGKLSEMNVRKPIKSDVENVIKKKIRQLQPSLDEHSALYSGAEDDEQTSIIEFSPFPASKARDKNAPQPEKVKESINKYKKLRREIGNVLKKESVSAQTKTLVTSTLDRLISQMISSQCNLRTDDNAVPVNRAQGSLLKVGKAEMLRSWTKKWQDLITQYTIGSQDSDQVGAGYKEMFLFLIRLREFFFQIHDELNMLNDRYMVKCQLTDKNPKQGKATPQSLRTRPKDDENPCNFIRICSEELRAFLMDFYMNLKETVEVVFKNYVEMYKRDITTDTSKEKVAFIQLINDMSVNFNERIDKSFQKETIKLEMKEYNSTKDKYKILKKFIQTTVDIVQIISERVVTTHLRSLESKLRSTIKQDLLTSIGIELNNFKTERFDKICSQFQTCNGNSTRRVNFYPKDSLAIGKNNINVKLKIGFEDLDSFRKSLNIGKSKRNGDIVNIRYQRSNPKPPFDIKKYAHIKVTRTRHTTMSTKITKKLSPTSTTTNPTSTTKATTQNETTTAIVATKTTYTYADHVKKMRRLGKIKPLNSTMTGSNTDSTTTLSYLDLIKKKKAEGKIAGPESLKRAGESKNSVLDLFEV